MHVQLADEAICIGKAPASESYCGLTALSARRKSRTWTPFIPGYGFLSRKRPTLPKFVESCNIRFIGASPRAMQALADKAVSRMLAKKAGVATPPGSDGIVEKEAGRPRGRQTHWLPCYY